MKRIVPVFLFFLLMSAACKGSVSETAQLPIVAGVSGSTALPENNLEPTREALRKVEQDELTASHPGSAGSGDIAVTEVPLAIVESIASPDTYPGPTVPGSAEWDDFVVTEVPLAIVESDATPDTYPGPADSGAELTEQPIISEEATSSSSTNLDSTRSSNGTINYGYQIVNRFPHDQGSFVQGLVVDDDTGILLEGSGLWGESSLRRVVLETGAVTQYLPLAEQYFGEGITVFDDRIFQLTYRSGVGFVYDSDSFNLLKVFNYAHEGWGITHDGQQLIVSDGTDTLHFWDPETMQETHQTHVFDEFGPVTRLNELEFVDGEILANVWGTNTIVRINPNTGQVTGRIDLSGLLAEDDRLGTEGVLNGIAYDSRTGRLFVTGKRWPTLYEIELVPLDSQD